MSCRSLMLLGLAVLFCGCHSDVAEMHGHDDGAAKTINRDQDTKPANVSSKPNQSAVATSVAIKQIPAAIRGGKVEFRVGEGEEVFSFKPKEEESCKFYDAAGTELCKFTLSSDGVLKSKSEDDAPLFELKPKDQKIMIKDASGENELFKFKLKGDTIDFYLPGDKRVYRIKKQDYGWRLEDNADKTLFRAKIKDEKIVLRDLNDQTVLYSKDVRNPLCLVFFKMDELSREQQAACCLYFMDK